VLALISGRGEDRRNGLVLPAAGAYELANALVLGAPVLMAATLGALVVAVVRWSARRR
jgi:hypothetical protein